MKRPRAITDDGVLRGALQPVRFAELAAPVKDIYGETWFKEGDHVALQYWGHGVTRVTLIDSHLSFPCITSMIQVYEPEGITLDYRGAEERRQTEGSAHK